MGRYSIEHDPAHDSDVIKRNDGSWVNIPHDDENDVYTVPGHVLKELVESTQLELSCICEDAD